ncbi:MAG: hypothetical protein LH481_12260 [Burkholderiales bacterium]|nr:hypothetical protein [Burkholderiales bacterium]
MMHSFLLALRRQRSGILFGVLAMLCTPVLFAAPADDLRKLLEQAKHDEAYRVAKTTPGELGNPPFDFYFGVAAINSGKASEGVLALERYLLNFPDSQTARLELARGYFLLSDDDRARDEFEATLATNPPADIVKVVREYLTAIAAREARYKTTYTFSIELGGGRDSNVQSGVSDPNITLPVFGDITLADTAVATGDRFSNVALAGRVSVPVRPRWSVFAQIAADLKQYRVANTYDQNTYSGAAGFTFSQGQSLYKFTMGKTTQTLDNARYRDTWSLGADYGRQIGNAGVLTLGTQIAKFGYEADNAIRNADYTSLQGGYRHQFSGFIRIELDSNLSVAREELTREGFEALSRNLWGGRFGVNISPLSSWTIGAAATYLKSNYLAEDPLLSVKRRDEYIAYDLSVNYVFMPQWSVRGEYLVSHNKSNLPLYEYKRRIGQFKLRYDFR